MTTFLKVDDELKRTLGFLPDDESLDEQSLNRIKTALTAAEIYVQNAIGQGDEFYQKEDVEPLYKIACFAVAANIFNHPSSATSSTTAMAIIGQMRGAYAVFREEQENGSTSESGQTNTND